MFRHISKAYVLEHLTSSQKFTELKKKQKLHNNDQINGLNCLSQIPTFGAKL